MAVKNLIFDLGNVLLRLDQQATSRAFINLGATSFPTLAQHGSHATLVDYETGKITEEEFRQKVRAAVGLPATVTDQEFDTAWNAMLLDFPKDRLELMRTLRRDYGYKVYLLSNTNALHIAHVDKICLQSYPEDSLHPFFDKVYYSHEIGSRKPSKEAFDHILQDQGLLAGETLFLDDMPENVQAAKDCGLQAVQVMVDTDLGFLQLRF
ncbi:hypothetical protein BGZ73_004677 [Actinomortierella ambigua]|nr:hypothetical protein BGZ73_004677 [Actinomortierella ambigua]